MDGKTKVSIFILPEKVKELKLFALQRDMTLSEYLVHAAERFEVMDKYDLFKKSKKK